jgi:hypothetical protein
LIVGQDAGTIDLGSHSKSIRGARAQRAANNSAVARCDKVQSAWQGRRSVAPPSAVKVIHIYMHGFALDPDVDDGGGGGGGVDVGPPGAPAAAAAENACVFLLLFFGKGLSGLFGCCLCVCEGTLKSCL